jgi:hypothetical protein
MQSPLRRSPLEQSKNCRTEVTEGLKRCEESNFPASVDAAPPSASPPIVLVVVVVLVLDRFDRLPTTAALQHPNTPTLQSPSPPVPSTPALLNS